MRAFLAAALAALAVPMPAAHAVTHRLAATCNAAWVDYLLDHTGSAVVDGLATAGGDARPVTTEIVCDVQWQYSSPQPELRQRSDGGIAVAAKALVFRSGYPTLCVQATTTWDDGYVTTTPRVCAFNTTTVYAEAG